MNADAHFPHNFAQKLTHPHSSHSCYATLCSHLSNSWALVASRRRPQNEYSWLQA